MSIFVIRCLGKTKTVFAAPLVVIFIASSVAAAKSAEHQLLPASRTFLTLQLCASYSLEFDQSDSLAERYSNQAWRVADAIAEAGWERGDFPGALATAQEERRELAVKSSETRDDFKRRHQSGPLCARALDHARILLGGALPRPDEG
ncbi:hypothetical protein [Marinobacter zhanjiangensis]|uniref:hypothetical protein n=1 Tax=Marinobacter zhanjiangensis TaxID=578215 RepID=UPI0016784B8B|nr:hypothetical protein [Marinobacter zhanjiangensis]